MLIRFSKEVQKNRNEMEHMRGTSHWIRSITSNFMGNKILPILAKLKHLGLASSNCIMTGV